MDNQTLSLDFGAEDSDRFKELTRRIAEFMAYFETAEHKLWDWKQEIDTTMKQHRENIEQELSHIQQELQSFANMAGDFTNEMGLARFRLAAESALEQGQSHLRALEETCQTQLDLLEKSSQNFERIAQSSFEKLDRASAYTIKNISEAVSQFRIHDFQRIAEKSYELVYESANDATTAIHDTLKWSLRKNLMLAFAITVFSTLTIGLYIGAEFPWESHRQAMLQRNLGQAVLTSWQDLSPQDKERILQFSKKPSLS